LASTPKRRARDRDLRIIGGTWRGRRFRFPAVDGIRPTPDRVRETLFNWLMHRIDGARCLDLFAGSGALGLEGLSRGARHVTFVERDLAAARALRATLGVLGAPPERATIVENDAVRFLQGTGQPYDVVFVDPPFDSPLLQESCALLASNDWLVPDARVYLELPYGSELPLLPADWRVIKDGRAGEVGYYLASRNAEGARSA